MVTRRNGKRKEIWCVSNAKNRDTLNIVGPQTLPTFLKAIACRKGTYLILIVHSPKRLRRTQGELMDVANPPICQQSSPQQHP